MGIHTPMDTQLAQLLDERDAIRLVVDFYVCLDRGDGAGCAACFAEDGVWERDVGAVTGHAAITQAVAKRPVGRRTAHTVMNLRFDADAEGEGRGTLRFTLVAYEGTVPEGSEAAAVPQGRVAGIRDCKDVLRKVDGHWRIQRRTSTATLRMPAAQ